MKTKLIFASLAVAALSARAQYVVTNGVAPPSAQVFRLGAGGGNLHFASGSGGVIIQSNAGDRALLELQTPSGTGSGITGANRTIFQAHTSGTFLDMANNSLPFFLMPNGSKIAVGHLSPAYQFDLKTSGFNDGISITQTGTDAAALHLSNSSSGGKHWALFSTGSNNGQGAGNFSIFEYGQTDRIFVQGGTGNVGINTISPINARLEIQENKNNASFNRAVYGITNSSGTLWNTGLEGRAYSVVGDNYGVLGRAYGGQPTGGWFYADGYAVSSFGTPIGVYGEAVGPYTSWAGYFMGDVYSAGTYQGSDIKLKKDIQPLSGALSKISLLKPSLYNFRTDEFKDMHLPEGEQMGLIAQEVETVFPGLIKEVKGVSRKDEKGEVMSNITDHKSVNYTALIPLLIAGVQEQQKAISDLTAANEAQQKQIEEQKEMISQLLAKNNTATGLSSLSIEAGFQMSQNEPNPFTHETVVKYTLPTTVQQAFVAVYDLSGKQVTTFQITEKGASSLTITAEKLAAGIYIYTIVADGKVMDTKRMIVAEK